VRWLVVGIGSIGWRHLTNLVRLDAGPVSVCDRNPGAVERAGHELGAKGFTDLADALAAGPDAVLVCTPTHLHVGVARAALEAGAHLLVEKPLAADTTGTADLAALARARGRRVLAACNMRFHPGVAHLRQALDDRLLASPLFFRSRFSHYLPSWRPGRDYRAIYSARRQEGGGIILEGVHEIDYLRWLAGEVTAVTADASRLSTLEIESEDYALVRLTFETGAVGQIHLDYLSPVKLRGCEIVGEDGTLEWRSEGKAPEQVHVRVWRAGAGRWEDLYRSAAYDANEMYLAELRHFIDCVEGRAEPLLDIDGARRVLALALTARGESTVAPEAG
jgi:predicted dehydrogenase